MSFENILSDLTIGEKQQAGIMSVYPLIGKDILGVCEFNKISFLRTSSYGSMEFLNDSSDCFIMPSGYSIISKQAAQDHGLPLAALIRPQTNTINYACCIQQTQGGYLSGKKIDQNKFNFLPLDIRKSFLKSVVNDNDKYVLLTIEFSQLWEHISAFQASLIKRNQANLVLFFNAFMGQLLKFTAEFERVPNQRGAIVCINNRIVGIEITPSESYFHHIWHALIRDCYGSEIVRIAKLNLIKEFETYQESTLDLDKCETIEDIKKAISLVSNKDKEGIRYKVEEISSLETNSVDSRKLSNDQKNICYELQYTVDKKYVAESFHVDNKLAYLSLLNI